MATQDAPSSLLIVIGEPMAEEHVTTILDRVTDGLSAWNQNPRGFLDFDKPQVDLNTEVRNFCNANVARENVESGGAVLRYGDGNLSVEVLVSPTVEILRAGLSHLLKSPSSYKHVIHAGVALAGGGAWILQDGAFSLNDFSSLLHRADVRTALLEIAPNSTLVVSCFPEGEWNEQGVKRYGLDKLANVSLGELRGNRAVDASCAADLQTYLRRLVTYESLDALLPASKVVGSIRFRRPTVYLFPAGEGDAVLFGVNGFTILLDGGYYRKPCFWDFLRHVDRVDALLISRLSANTVLGISSFVNRLAIDQCHPKLGYCFGNIPNNHKPTGTQDEQKDPLLLSIFAEGKKLRDQLGGLNLKLHPTVCSISPTSKHSEPMTLYQKVGQGRLDMYVLHPVKDSKELAEFTEAWSKGPASTKAQSSLNGASIAALLVWRPANPQEQIIRFLYPGSCTQDKILSGLEKLKHLDILKHAVCTPASLEASSTKIGAIAPKKQAATKPSASLGSPKSAAARTPAAPTSIAANASPAAMSPVAKQPSPPKTDSAPPERKDIASPPAVPSFADEQPLLDLASPNQPFSPAQPEAPILEPAHLVDVAAAGDHWAGFGVAAEPAVPGPFEAADAHHPIEPAVLRLSADQLHEHSGGDERAQLEEPSQTCPQQSPGLDAAGHRVGSPMGVERDVAVGGDLFGVGEEEPTGTIGSSQSPLSQPQGSPDAEPNFSSLNPDAPAFFPVHAECSPTGDNVFAGKQEQTASPLDPFPPAGQDSAMRGVGFDSYRNGSADQLDDGAWSADPKRAGGFQSYQTGEQQSPVGDSPDEQRKKVQDVKKEWGEPLGLPTPTATSKGRQQGATAPAKPKANGPPSGSKPATSAAPKRPGAAAATSTKSPAESKAVSGPAAAKKTPVGAAAAPRAPSALASKAATATAKPGHATATRTLAAKPAPRATPPTAAAARTGAAAKKTGPPPPSYYVDLTYIPQQGDPQFCNQEFFKHVRAKYYVLSTAHPAKETLEALLNGKKGWNLPEEEATLIPTYDSDTLALWMGLHKDELAAESIDVAPSCCRCTVNLEEEEQAKCAAYRLEL